jgi:uncharacterized protein (DUF2147 family)
MPSTPLRRHVIAAMAACLTVAGVHAASAQATAVGAWNTISDTDGRPTAVVEIREVDGELVGTITALLVAAEPEDSVCGKCSGERKGQRVVGMEILRHMRPDGDAWSGGEILDPETGKTYKAKMKLIEGGNKLVVRGYIGLPMFGRSQTWVRRQ